MDWWRNRCLVYSVVACCLWFHRKSTDTPENQPCRSESWSACGEVLCFYLVLGVSDSRSDVQLNHFIQKYWVIVNSNLFTIILNSRALYNWCHCWWGMILISHRLEFYESGCTCSHEVNNSSGVIATKQRRCYDFGSSRTNSGTSEYLQDYIGLILTADWIFIPKVNCLK